MSQSTGNSSTNLQTRLKRVRGLGSAHHGAHHWWLQRVTAVAMIPLALWFTAAVVTGMLSPNVVKVAVWFASPVNAVMMVLLLLSMFVHARLGVQVVIEDYVKCPVKKYGLLLLNTFLCVVFAALSILAVLKLHFLDMGASV
jgi:succinate dehydrogenase / fumarate reductase membrane anchor subunit